jgi:hypothetical protein
LVHARRSRAEFVSAPRGSVAAQASIRGTPPDADAVLVETLPRLAPAAIVAHQLHVAEEL